MTHGQVVLATAIEWVIADSTASVAHSDWQGLPGDGNGVVNVEPFTASNLTADASYIVDLAIRGGTVVSTAI